MINLIEPLLLDSKVKSYRLEIFLLVLSIEIYDELLPNVATPVVPSVKATELLAPR